jgi:hypothetical protein
MQDGGRYRESFRYPLFREVNLPTKPSARVEMSDDKEELVLPGLDKLDDPQGFIRRREASEIPVAACGPA